MKYSLFILMIVLLGVSCQQQVARKPISRKTESFLKESIERNKSLIEHEEDELIKMMADDSVHVYINSTNGFWYYHDLKNSEKTQFPEIGDEVLFTYEVRDINNNLIYSMETIGEQSYFIDQQELITGLQEGLKLMEEGEIVTFLFPSYKAYGYSGDQKKIGVNQPLIYKVQLNKINKSKTN